MDRVISRYNKKRMVENISGDWKDKLENFSKRIQEEENMTQLVLDLNPSPVDGCGEGSWSKKWSRKAAREVTMTTRSAGTNTHRHTDNRELTQQDGREKKMANLV